MPGPMIVDLRTGVATGAGTDTFAGVESVLGSVRGDLLIGDTKANGLGGGEGSDVIRGGAGADRPLRRRWKRPFAGPGDDFLRSRKIQTAHGPVLLRDAGVITFVDTFDLETFELISSDVIIKGPHPEAESDFALFCEVFTEALA